jgi:hypothetical protein
MSSTNAAPSTLHLCRSMAWARKNPARARYARVRLDVGGSCVTCRSPNHSETLRTRWNPLCRNLLSCQRWRHLLRLRRADAVRRAQLRARALLLHAWDVNERHAGRVALPRHSPYGEHRPAADEVVALLVSLAIAPISLAIADLRLDNVLMVAVRGPRLVAVVGLLTLVSWGRSPRCPICQEK